jgi:hypothetical protein
MQNGLGRIVGTLVPAVWQVEKLIEIISSGPPFPYSLANFRTGVLSYMRDSIVPSRKYSARGNPKETPTVSTAISGSHQFLPSRPRSKRTKTNTTTLETITSVAKNALTRLANNWFSNSEASSPFSITQGTNCQ